MSNNDYLSGTITVLIVTFDLDPLTERKDLTMQDLQRILAAGIGGTAEPLADDEADSILEPVSTARVIH